MFQVNQRYFGRMMHKMWQQVLRIFYIIGVFKVRLLNVFKIVNLVTSQSESKIILSPTDLLYIGHGTTNIWVNKTNGDFKSWRQIYLDFTVRPNGVDP